MKDFSFFGSRPDRANCYSKHALPCLSVWIVKEIQFMRLRRFATNCARLWGEKHKRDRHASLAFNQRPYPVKDFVKLGHQEPASQSNSLRIRQKHQDNALSFMAAVLQSFEREVWLERRREKKLKLKDQTNFRSASWAILRRCCVCCVQ